MNIQTTAALDVTPEVIARGEALGVEFGCPGALHPSDHLLSYLLQYSQGDGLREYFDNGAKDARQAEAVYASLGLPAGARCLEFASGYGRVTRHLRGMNLVASDIHPEAMTFTWQQLGVPVVVAPPEPEDFAPGEQFDFIFVVSLFSHLPDHNFARWLKRLVDLLTPTGYLMFTTHGEKAAKRVPVLLEAFDEMSGYGFIPYSDQPDLEGAIYGSTIVSNTYVEKQIRAVGAETIRFAARAWWAAQDEWIVRRW